MTMTRVRPRVQSVLRCQTVAVVAALFPLLARAQGTISRADIEQFDHWMPLTWAFVVETVESDDAGPIRASRVYFAFDSDRSTSLWLAWNPKISRPAWRIGSPLPSTLDHAYQFWVQPTGHFCYFQYPDIASTGVTSYQGFDPFGGYRLQQPNLPGSFLNGFVVGDSEPLLKLASSAKDLRILPVREKFENHDCTRMEFSSPGGSYTVWFAKPFGVIGAQISRGEDSMCYGRPVREVFGRGPRDAPKSVVVNIRLADFASIEGKWLPGSGTFSTTIARVNGSTERNSVVAKRTLFSSATVPSIDLWRIGIPNNTPAIIIRNVDGAGVREPMNYSWKDGRLVPASDPKHVGSIADATDVGVNLVERRSYWSAFGAIATGIGLGLSALSLTVWYLGRRQRVR